jgi:hypothetical protein
MQETKALHSEDYTAAVSLDGGTVELITKTIGCFMKAVETGAILV